MEAVKFPQANVMVGKGQKEYLPVPGHIEKDDPSGELTYCFELSVEEMIELMHCRKIYVQLLTHLDIVLAQDNQDLLLHHFHLELLHRKFRRFPKLLQFFHH